MMKEHILLIFGGDSAEHKISCISAATIYKALTNLRYTVTCIGITLQNCMYQQEPMICFDERTSSEYIAIIESETYSVVMKPGNGFYCNGIKLSIDIIFPIIHGSYGEDGRLQGLFDFLPIPYIGCNFFGSFLGFSKYTAKIYWEKANFPVVPYLTINEYDYNHDLDHFEKSKNFKELVKIINRTLTYPIFIKPDCAGSSFGISKVTSSNDIYKAIVTAAKVSKRILIEQAITGREIEISILGRNNDFFISSPGEIITDMQFYTFKAKYITSSKTAVIEVPADLPQTAIIEAKKLASLAYTSLSCKGFARIDMFYESKTNNLYLNEINTLPGFTESSMFIKLLKNSGVTWDMFMKKIIKFARDEFKEKQKKIW
jgi:D-alanine-D-alanine ligase